MWTFTVINSDLHKENRDLAHQDPRTRDFSDEVPTLTLMSPDCPMGFQFSMRKRVLSQSFCEDHLIFREKNATRLATDQPKSLLNQEYFQDK